MPSTEAKARRPRRVRASLWMVMLVAIGWFGVETCRRASRDTQVLATTVCPFRGAPEVVLTGGVVPADTAAVRAHEEVHVGQCLRLGPWRYRWENLGAAGKLALEAPAYCAGAAERIRGGLDSTRTRRRLVDDATEALGHLADSAAVVAALRRNCRAIAGA